jgi:hypothetical protein
MYYGMDPVLPYPEQYLWVLVSSKCAADLYPLMALVGHSAVQLAEHICVQNAACQVPLHIFPGFRTHQASGTYCKICLECTPFDFLFIADRLLSHKIAKNTLCVASVDCWQLWYR